MRPPPEPRPSLLSTVVFALLAFFLTGLSGVLAGLIREATQPEEVALWWGLTAGCIGAAIAAWGWRAPREKRFHITYLSGLALLITAWCHLFQLQRMDLREETAIWLAMAWLLQGPLFAWFLATLGLVLILVAQIQDRR